MTRVEILLAEDERTLRASLASWLTERGYDVRTASDGEAALAHYRARRPDLLLLDVMMPKLNGYEVCAEIRKTDAETPILFLTALEAPENELRGWDVGADQYVPKTVSPDVLLARIAAVCRRKGIRASAGDFDFGSWRVESSNLRLRGAEGTEVELTVREVEILRDFAAHPGEVLSRDFLARRHWPEAPVDDNVLSVALFRLREKLGLADDSIRTIRGVGYVYNPRLSHF